MFCLIWFGSDSPQFFFAFVLAPIPGSSICSLLLATLAYLFQYILHSWVGLQVAANVWYRWLHKSWFISSGGDAVSPEMCSVY